MIGFTATYIRGDGVSVASAEYFSSVVVCHTIGQLTQSGYLVPATGFFFAAGSYLVTVAVFVLVYRLLPRTAVNWKDTLPGAFLAGLLWEIAKYIFALSLNYFHYDQIYGSV